MIIVDKCCPTVMGLYLMGALGEETPVVENFIQQNHVLYYTALNPLDATNYWFQNPNMLTTANGNRERTLMIWGQNCEIVMATVDIYVGGTLASGETSGLVLEDSDDNNLVTIADSIKFTAIEEHYQWSGSVTLQADKPYRFKLTTPTWVTNPTSVNLVVTAIFKLP